MSMEDPQKDEQDVRGKEEADSQHEKGDSDSGEEKPPEMDIDPENEITGIKLILIHVGICLCTSLVGLDFTLIATAVPVITSEFNSLRDVGWYGSAFYIALCASQPLAGKMFTLFSKKVVYLASVGIFELGSLVCALAPTSNALIAGRAITGFGASGLFAGGFVLLTTIIPLYKRAIWTGTQSSVFTIATIIGPLIGGALTQRVTWRWCFYINLPIGGFAAALVVFFFRIKSAPTENAPLLAKLKGLDSVGFVLFASSVTMLLLALQFGGTTYAWNSSQIIGLIVGFGVVMLLFIPWQLYLQDDALIPPRLFKYRNACLLFGSSIFVNGPFQTIVYWLPIWFQAVLGVSPEGSAVRYLPTVVSDSLTAVIGAGIVMQLGVWNPFLILAEALVCLGAGLLTTIYPTISDGHWIGYQIFGGIGYSLACNLVHLGMQASLPPDLIPIGATTLLFGISTSCAVFLSIDQTIFDSRLFAEISKVAAPDVVTRVISVGATSVRSVVSPSDLPAVLQAYSNAVTQVFYLPAFAPVISFLLLLGCKWTSVKKPKANKTDSEVGEKGDT